MRAPLWLDIKGGKSGPMTVSLATCRNCGQVKATTTPCSFDHLAAVMEFGDYLRERAASSPTPRARAAMAEERELLTDFMAWLEQRPGWHSEPIATMEAFLGQRRLDEEPTDAPN